MARVTDNNAMNRSRENLAVTISADWHSPIISATIYLRVARRGSIIADVIRLNAHAIQTKCLISNHTTCSVGKATLASRMKTDSNMKFTATTRDSTSPVSLGPTQKPYSIKQRYCFALSSSSRVNINQTTQRFLPTTKTTAPRA